MTITIIGFAVAITGIGINIMLKVLDITPQTKKVWGIIGASLIGIGVMILIREAPLLAEMKDYIPDLRVDLLVWSALVVLLGLSLLLFFMMIFREMAVHNLQEEDAGGLRANSIEVSPRLCRGTRGV